MIERRKRFGAFIIPIMIIAIGIGNYSRLPGTESVRSIHIVSLLAIGIGIGVLIRNISLLFAKDKHKMF